MPTDPTTGDALPYKGQPGYEAAKKKYPEIYAAAEAEDEEMVEEELPGDEGPDEAPLEEDVEIPEDGIVPDRDLKPLMDQADEILAAEEGEAVEGEEIEGETGDDIQPLMETLGMSEQRAQEIYEAAMEIPKYAAMSGQELADLIADDFQVLMELERMAAQKAKPEEPAPEGAPLGMPPGAPEGALMPGGPQGEPTL